MKKKIFTTIILVAIFVGFLPSSSLATGLQARYEANRPAVSGPDVSERAFNTLATRGLWAAIAEDYKVLCGEGLSGARFLAADLIGGGLAIAGFSGAAGSILLAGGGYGESEVRRKLNPIQPIEDALKGTPTS